MVVVGVGNVLLSDDGAGVHAARLLMEDRRVPPGVRVLDGGTLGLELLAHLSGAERILFLDAIDTGAPAGELIRLTGQELLETNTGWTVHQLGIADLAGALAFASGEPPEIVVLGVQPASTDWGTTLTPAVEAALAPLVDAAVRQIVAWQ